jgi:predicted RNA binding protein YcfA (HicA-like mRNA interferase family)
VKLPRDLSGDALATALARFGYKIERQSGSHMQLATMEGGEHHVTVPRHGAVRVGTLRRIVREVANHAGLNTDQALAKLFR